MAGNDVFLRSVPSDVNRNDVRLYDPNATDGAAAYNPPTSFGWPAVQSWFVLDANNYQARRLFPFADLVPSQRSRRIDDSIYSSWQTPDTYNYQARTAYTLGLISVSFVVTLEDLTLDGIVQSGTSLIDRLDLMPPRQHFPFVNENQTLSRDNLGFLQQITDALMGKVSGAYTEIRFGAVRITVGSGSPNGAVTGDPGDLYLSTAGGASTTLYVKTSGFSTSIGWTGK